MGIINLTPHDVKMVNDEGEVVKVYPRGNSIARVAVETEKMWEIDGFYLVSQQYGDILDLPEVEGGTYYLVSMVTREAAKLLGRFDVISPDTSPGSVVRDESGQIIGVKQFVY